MRNTATSGKGRRNLSGKLVLAAVVHQVECPAEAVAPHVTLCEDTEGPFSKKPSDAHNSDTNNNKGGLRRLSRLLFSNRRRAKQSPTCFVGTNKLIDSKNNNSLGGEHLSQFASANDNNKADEANAEQVIEFKFDLIVEDQQQIPPRPIVEAKGQRARENANANQAQVGQVGGGDNLDDSNNDVAPVSVLGNVSGSSWKLGENVDELVESFVLDSNDVCLMSLGRPAETVISLAGHQLRQQRQELQAASSLAVSSAPSHFHYVSSLAAHTLAYSFQLLHSSACERRRLDQDRHHHQDQFHQHQHQQRRPQRRCTGESEDDDESNHYSIELGATLFACLRKRPVGDASNRSSQQNRFAIVDLLRDCDGSEQDNCLQQSNEIVDCSSLEQALETLQRLTSRLAKVEKDEDSSKDKRLLIFHFRLKQRINGGLFSNRMCVIDFQPEFIELHSIFESIFNGQALAYLKQRQHYLQNPFNSTKLAKVDDISSLIGAVDVEGKQHHQVASLDCNSQQQSLVLLEAEWALYKHLSAALIRTLVVVHVRKLATLATCLGGQEDREKRFANQMMLDNLCLLEFAHSIQEASAQRLKRRKRHLRSHLASSTTSVASNQSASTCLVSNRNLLANSGAHLFAQHPTPTSTIRNKTYLEGAQTGSRSLRSRCQRRAMDMSMMMNRHHHYRAHCHKRVHTANLSGPELTGTESSSLSTTSSGSRRQDRHHQRGARHLKSYATNRLLSSTTNGGGRNGYTAMSLANTNINSDDSDSITSANLNSCSSVASYLFGQNSSIRSRQQSGEPWTTTEVEQAQIEFTSAMNLASTCGSQPQAALDRQRQTTASNVIQIDCPAATTMTTMTKSSLTMSNTRWCGKQKEEDNASDMEDEASSVVIAEPPKQLKLEEFLTQLSSIISPIRGGSSTELTAAKLNHLGDLSAAPVTEINSDGRQAEATSGGGCEEDEDCKSHSSILEHLSSLALESNAKLNNRQQHLGSADHLTARDAGVQLVQQVEQLEDYENSHPQQRREQPTTGHLQRLLNSSFQLQKKGSSRVTVLRSEHPMTRSPDIEDRLRALSAAAVSPSASSSSGVFAQSSSNCDSNSSCSSSLSTAPPPPPPPLPPSLAASKHPDLYATVVNKHHQARNHIKT